MKSGTLSYKKTWMKKNLVRFAPFWALYALCLLLGLALMGFSQFTGSGDRFYFIMNLAECARLMAIVNCGYALLTAQLLFGDLYSSRMCYGIHALPLRREEIFSVNVLSGLLFSLMPTALMTLAALPMAMSSGVENGAAVPLLWFGASNLQYLFFFSLAVFSSFCTGSRFSMAVIYGILNFFSMLLYLLVETLYMPLLPGVDHPFHWFQAFCPVGQVAVDPLLLVQRSSRETPGSFEVQTGSWMYLLILAAVSVLLLMLALQMYRKRPLETAGEFIAVRALRPIFLILFSLFAAVALNLATQMFFGTRQPALLTAFTAVGLTAGWFVGLMLLERSPKVFGKRSFMGVGALLAVVAVSLLLTHFDVFHIVSWVPDPQKVESAYVIQGYGNYSEYWKGREDFLLTETEELKAAAELHRHAMGEGLREEDARWFYDRPAYETQEEAENHRERYTVPVSLEYHMKDGSVRRRFYYVYADGEAGTLAEKFFSRPSGVMDNPELLDLQQVPDWIQVNGFTVDEKYLTAEDGKALLTALKQDMQEGNLAQMQEFHTVPVWADEEETIDCLYLSVGFRVGMWQDSFYLEIYSDSTHTMQWFRERGILAQIIKDTSNRA